MKNSHEFLTRFICYEYKIAPHPNTPYPQSKFPQPIFKKARPQPHSNQESSLPAPNIIRSSLSTEQPAQAGHSVSLFCRTSTPLDHFHSAPDDNGYLRTRVLGRRVHVHFTGRAGADSAGATRRAERAKRGAGGAPYALTRCGPGRASLRAAAGSAVQY